MFPTLKVVKLCIQFRFCRFTFAGPETLIGTDRCQLGIVRCFRIMNEATCDQSLINLRGL